MAESALSEDHLDLILEKMYATKGWDFRRYRKSSIMRCVERRLALSRLPSTEYIERLDQQPLEFNTLFNHITIKVSEFFRDPEVFDRIEGEVLPLSLERLRSQDRNLIRVWSCGCARGEEVYSMAILLHRSNVIPAQAGIQNAARGLDSHFRGNDGRSEGLSLKIFATDIDEAAIDLARKGDYLRDSLAKITPSILSQFFRPTDTGYQVASFVRNLVTFGVHNMVSDIHLSHMDIILCRNLLIYFEKDLQEKVFEKLYYSLNKGGFLILGKSEVIPPLFREQFCVIARKEKIYQKI